MRRMARLFTALGVILLSAASGAQVADVGCSPEVSLVDALAGRMNFWAVSTSEVLAVLRTDAEDVLFHWSVDSDRAEVLERIRRPRILAGTAHGSSKEFFVCQILPEAGPVQSIVYRRGHAPEAIVLTGDDGDTAWGRVYGWLAMPEKGLVFGQAFREPGGTSDALFLWSAAENRTVAEASIHGTIAARAFECAQLDSVIVRVFDREQSVLRRGMGDIDAADTVEELFRRYKSGELPRGFTRVEVAAVSLKTLEEWCAATRNGASVLGEIEPGLEYVIVQQEETKPSAEYLRLDGADKNQCITSIRTVELPRGMRYLWVGPKHFVVWDFAAWRPGRLRMGASEVKGLDPIPTDLVKQGWPHAANMTTMTVLEDGRHVLIWPEQGEIVEVWNLDEDLPMHRATYRFVLEEDLVRVEQLKDRTAD